MTESSQNLLSKSLNTKIINAHNDSVNTHVVITSTTKIGEIKFHCFICSIMNLEPFFLIWKQNMGKRAKTKKPYVFKEEKKGKREEICSNKDMHLQKDAETYRSENRVILSRKLRNRAWNRGGRWKLEIGRATSMHQRSMDSSKLHCFSNGSLYLLSADFMVAVLVVVLKALKDLSSSSSSRHERHRKIQSRTYTPKENNSIYTYTYGWGFSSI